MVARTGYLLALALGCGMAAAQSTSKPVKVSRYLAGPPLELQSLVTEPAAIGSKRQKAELATLHQLQDTRTPGQVQAAQRDDHEESIFAYATVLGPRFREPGLPLTAALSLHLRQESAVVNPALKLAFHRARPYRTDATLHPVCDLATTDSYPSGHSMVGYLEGFALAEMLPARRGEILARAADYAHNRMVCGVHYGSDTEASRTIALALFGALLSTPTLQHELAAARAEIEHQLSGTGETR